MTVQNELLSDEEHRKIEELVEQEEGGVHRFASWWGTFLTAIAVAMTLFHLYAAASTVDQQSLREIHVAFTAPNRATVDTVHRAARELGAEILHEPREWPEYHPGYYAVFVRDPDGNNTEVVSHS